jgi:phosphonate transport system substrate-binding protein
MSRSLARPPLALVLAIASLTLGCDRDGPLRIETEGAAGFDPQRFDAGPQPSGELGVEKLRWSMTPFYTPARQRKMMERMRVHLQDAVGVPVEAKVADGYLDAVAGLVKGELDVAQLSPYACVAARERLPGATFLATAIAQGTTTYASYIVVPIDSEIERLAQARGKVLAFTDPGSSSGFLYPRALLVRQGFDPEKDFDVRFTGKHDASLAAVIAGRVDLAAVSSDTLVTQRALGLSGPVRILAKAGRIPYDCVVAREGLTPLALWRLRRALLSLSILTPEGRDVLRDYNLINGFMPVPEGHYVDVARVAKLSSSAPRPAQVPSPGVLPDAGPVGSAP